MEQAKEVPGDPRGSQCTSNSQSPIPCHHASLIKKAIKLPSHRYLPAPNVLFSPSFLHFRTDFSFLPTFSGHFSLLPILFLSTLYGHREGCTDNRICQTFYIGCGKLGLGRNGDGVIFVGGRRNASWHGLLRLCGSSWECDFYKRINENKENAFQIPLFKNILKSKTCQNDFKMPLGGSWL